MNAASSGKKSGTWRHQAISSLLSLGQPFCILGFGLDQTGIGHEMALSLVYGANLGCVWQHFSSLARLKGSWGQLRPKTDPKHQKTKTKMAIVPRGRMPLSFTSRFTLASQRTIKATPTHGTPMLLQYWALKAASSYPTLRKSASGPEIGLPG